ncbi:MAG: di-trans,poly-cis-decaprenylcistransferase [Clostridia bacterium]|nr:di-trans,poly-cis-decaprenylcistransferase [Clostridia bacterium]
MPRHIGFIMDGNGRWATRRGLPRVAGHTAGGEAFKKICEYCINRNIDMITVYAFSTENWKRPQEEIEGLMKLFVENMHESIEGKRAKDMAITFIGDRTVFSPEMQKLMAETEKAHEHCPNKMNIAINYGGRAEIVRAARILAESGQEITEETMSRNMYTSHGPDPELIVRTGGEKRLSNFMLWQSAYSEFYFTDVLWPDFDEEQLDKALDYYRSVSRRFGGIK